MSGTVHNGGFTRVARAERFVGDPAHAAAAQEKAKADTAKYVDQMEARMQGQDYAVGGRYSFADPMLYVLCRWAPRVGKSLDTLPALAGFNARMEARPAVQATLKAEGLA
jgi:glutathione S-transferase